MNVMGPIGFEECKLEILARPFNVLDNQSHMDPCRNALRRRLPVDYLDSRIFRANIPKQQI